jgi:hypothetical protein
MNEDTVSLLIYVALALVGVIASAFKNKKKRQSTARSFRPEPTSEFPTAPSKEYGPELGPLMELFDIPRQKPEVQEYESIESGPSVEEMGMAVDTEEASIELSDLDNAQSSVEKQISEVETFEEGQSDIQKMIAKYEALRKDIEDDSMNDDIAKSEIVSVEAEEAAREKRNLSRDPFNLRKAIIYSEILKRREY